MAQNPLVEQAKQGNVNAIASLMNRLLKSQAMLANVEREGDRLEILIESDLRSLNDEVRIPKRQILVGMLKKWFVTLEVQNVSSMIISWQQAGSTEPAWTEEIYLVEQEKLDVSGNGGLEPARERPRIPPLPILPSKSMPERNNPSSSPDLDEMFGEINTSSSLQPIDRLNSELEDITVTQEPNPVIYLSDVQLGSDVSQEDDRRSLLNEEMPSLVNSPNSPMQFLLKTPSFPIQLIQYCVVCGVIIIGLRGMHSVLGGGKPAKASMITIESILV